MNNAQTDNLYNSVGSIFKLMLFFLSKHAYTQKGHALVVLSYARFFFYLKGKGLNYFTATKLHLRYSGILSRVDW